MDFEHTVVVPLGLSDARRLLDEFERRIPTLPGLVVRVELTRVDSGTTSVRLRGQLDSSVGFRQAVLAEAGLRMVRRYAEQVFAGAASRAKDAAARARGGDFVAGAGSPASPGPGPGPGTSRDGEPAPSEDANSATPLAGHVMQWGRVSAPTRHRVNPAVWVGASVLVVLLGLRRRRRRSARRRR